MNRKYGLQRGKCSMYASVHFLKTAAATKPATAILTDQKLWLWLWLWLQCMVFTVWSPISCMHTVCAVHTSIHPPEYEECQIDGMMFWVLFPVVDVLILAFAHVPISSESHTKLNISARETEVPAKRWYGDMKVLYKQNRKHKYKTCRARKLSNVDRANGPTKQTATAAAAPPPPPPPPLGMWNARRRVGGWSNAWNTLIRCTTYIRCYSTNVHVWHVSFFLYLNA